MPDAVGSITSPLARAAAAACVALSLTTPAFAQQPLAAAPATPEFMSRFDFAMWAGALSSDDERFTWDTHWAGDFDLVDYVHGRLTFLADYQALLGEEFRPFDPYQSSYTLAVSASVRRGPTEFAFVFHHVSRHLGDRPKRDSVAMNAMLGRVMRRIDVSHVLNGATLDIRGDLGPVVARAIVDYTWMGNVDLVLRRPLSRRVGVYGRTYGEAYAVDRAIAGRGRQTGGRIEAGVRFSGTGGAVELFAGYEKVIDADPLDREARRWRFAGFRLLGHEGR
jgi:hypothetical protein